MARKVAVSISIGNTYSGWAFSAVNDFKIQPLKIRSNVWNAGGKSLMSHKTPTALLLNPDKTFHSFGYDAENNYSALVEDNEDGDYYYFHHFLHILYKKVR